MWLYFINRVKAIHQGQGQIKVKVKNIYINLNFMQPILLSKWVVCIQLKCVLVKIEIGTNKLMIVALTLPFILKQRKF